jgi:hypothetical protein
MRTSYRQPSNFVSEYTSSVYLLFTLFRVRVDKYVVFSRNIIRMIKSRGIRWTAHVARVDDMGYAYRILIGNMKGKVPLGGPTRKWVDNIKMDLK